MLKQCRCVSSNGKCLVDILLNVREKYKRDSCDICDKLVMRRKI